jgi:hypothetical protein
MKAKNLLYFLATIIIIIAIFYVTSNGKKDKIANDHYLEWFNGWTSDLVKIKTIAHEKSGLIKIPGELKGEDLTNPEKLKEFRNFIQQLKKLELWKIDTGSVINDNWYNKIDQLLKEKLTSEQVIFVKNKLLEGEKNLADFRQVSVIYFDDYFNLINFMCGAVNDAISLGRGIDNNDINKFNNLKTIYNQSQENYTKAVNKIYAYDVKRLEEFNDHFKNPNITKILNLVK